MVSVHQQIDTCHEDMIHDAVVDYYGTKLATCSSDRTIKIFSISGNTHTFMTELRGHEGPVWQLAWAHPYFGNIIASCSYDRKVFIWKEVSPNVWEKVYEYDGHESSVNSVNWAPKEFGLVLASASSDETVSIITGSTQDGTWTSCKISAHTAGVNAVSWCPSLSPGLSLFHSNGKQKLVKRFVTGGCDYLVKIWKFNDEEDKWVQEHSLEGHRDWVRDVAWAPSMALPKTYIASCSQDCQVIIWSKNGNDDRPWAYRLLSTFDNVVWHVSWSVMGNILAVSGGDNKVSLWKENPNEEWICINEIQNKGS